MLMMMVIADCIQFQWQLCSLAGLVVNVNLLTTASDIPAIVQQLFCLLLQTARGKIDQKVARVKRLIV